jgi:hypothetical protein
MKLQLTCAQVRDTIERHLASGGVVLLSYGDEPTFPVATIEGGGRDYVDEDPARFIVPLPDGRSGFICFDRHDTFTLEGPVITGDIVWQDQHTAAIIEFLHPAPLVPHRRHGCDTCGCHWDAEVKLGQTTNLSGELTQYCPDCGQRASTGSPWFFAAPDSRTIPPVESTPLFLPHLCLHCGAEVFAENAGHHNNARCLDNPDLEQCCDECGRPACDDSNLCAACLFREP